MKNAIVAAVIIVAGAGIFWYVKSNQSTAQNPATPNSNSAPIESINPSSQGSPSGSQSSGSTATPTNTNTASGGITLAEVAKHADSSSCWTAINGSVYDLTSWINQHPGGEGAILSLCGIDGSDAFNAQHGGQRRPERELETFKIGDLKTN